MNNPHTIVIAEAGVNHNGDLSIAKKLIDVAAEAKADYVKFQTFKAQNLVTKKAEKASYQTRLTPQSETHYEMIKRLELDEKMHYELIKYCKSKEIKFLSTGFDIQSIDLLDKLGIPFFKIPSGEITNLPLLKYVANKSKSVVLSTGMANIDEIQNAKTVLLESGLDLSDLTFLHCNTEYPTPFKDVNLKAMLTIKDELNVNIGYSDHTPGIEVSVAAVALGATIIEKHFTLDREMEGPDHAASLEPNELFNMVKSIRNIEVSLGDGVKKPSGSEEKNIPTVRKSIVAKCFIGIGDTFTKDNIDVKRPGTGISPMEWDKVIGTKSKYNFEEDDLIKY